jgi:uncharacterized Zn-binding protein involved in type VI secretion
MPAVTRFGDADVAHCSGMTRSGKSSTVFLNGLGVSRKTDNNTGHLTPEEDPCPSHSAPITTGSTKVFADGLGVGRIGDGISSCTSVAAGSPDVFDGS